MQTSAGEITLSRTLGPQAILCGWEAGILFAYFKKPNKHGLFSRKPRRASNLAFSSSFVGVRLFTSVFVFCQRNDTRRETLLRESSTSIWKATLKDLPFAQPIFGELGFQSAPQASASTRSAMHSQESRRTDQSGSGLTSGPSEPAFWSAMPTAQPRLIP
jgi:hypothetical protein